MAKLEEILEERVREIRLKLDSEMREAEKECEEVLNHILELADFIIQSRIKEKIEDNVVTFTMYPIAIDIVANDEASLNEYTIVVKSYKVAELLDHALVKKIEEGYFEGFDARILSMKMTDVWFRLYIELEDDKIERGIW